MDSLTHYPILVFLLTFAMLWLGARFGSRLRGLKALSDPEDSADLTMILGATLTLLALIIGFTFSMATGRYDERKTFEEAEANAIGTEFVRADFLPPADGAKVRRLLVAYLDQRIAFYTVQDDARRSQIDRRTTQVQNDLWIAVREPAQAQPTAVNALVVSGMNDVLNSSGYTQAALWNRIPTAAWRLMMAISLCCSVLFGFASRSRKTWRGLDLVLPIVVAIAFLLIADIDAPRHGLIRVSPQNLESLAGSLHP